ncbi:hypothetical protein [Planomicrobium soli]|nr:hypothetical protein [Planomicrobium soli]
MEEDLKEQGLAAFFFFIYAPIAMEQNSGDAIGTAKCRNPLGR